MATRRVKITDEHGSVHYINPVHVVRVSETQGILGKPRTWVHFIDGSSIIASGVVDELNTQIN